jgi:hypothetical protein
MTTTLYKKAAAFDKNTEIITPNKKAFFNDIQDIKEKVNQIYTMKMNKTNLKQKV